MKRHIGGLLAVCACLHAQNITRFAGIYNAVDYAYGVPGSSPAALKISIGNQATGSQTVTLAYGFTTLSDGGDIYPLNTNAPIYVGAGPSIEKVTPSAITCPSPRVYNTCQFTATFTRIHGAGDPVTTATVGLQEALNQAHVLGGSVVVDGKWTAAGGTSAIINAATVPSGTAIADNRTGQVFAGSGGGAVTSVFGRTGTVTAMTGDYTAAQVTNAVRTDAANTFGAFTQTFTNSTLLIPSSAAAAPTVNASIAFDSTSHTYQFGSNGNTLALSYFHSSPPSSGSCLQTGTLPYEIVSTGSPCGAGGSSPLTTKGDLYGFTTVNARIPVGSDGQLLTADSTQAAGVKWGALTTDTTLTNTAGTYGVNLLQFCRLTNSCDIAALWQFAIGQDFVEQASGSTPAASTLHLYANTDNTFHYVTPDGTDHTFAGAPSPVWGSGYSAVTQTATAAAIDILFDTNDPNNTDPSMHSTVSNTDRWVAPVTGFYKITCVINTDSNPVASGQIYLTMFLNSGTSTPIGQERFSVSSTGTTTHGFSLQVTRSYHLTAGDYVRFQLDPVDSTITLNAGAHSTYAEMFQIH